MKRKLKIKEIIYFIILFCLFLVFQYFIQIANKSATVNMYKGVLVSLQYGVCLLMLAINLKHSTHFAIVLMSISAIAMLIIIIRGGKEAVPGLFNAMFYIITIIVIASFDLKRERESRTDFITGAYNRKGLYIELQDKIDSGRPFNIYYLSFGNFKEINDSYGHAYGDELLRKVSQRIKMNFGKECLVSRVGGAEFVVAIEGNNDVELIADRLLEAIREKAILVVDDNSVECYIEGYAGAANFPKDATDYESLIKYADIAMSEAILNKSKKAYLFCEEMLDRINRQSRLRNYIKDSLQNDYFYLVYQPQFDVIQKKIRGFETLIRMKTADGENISPGEFIPVAERSDLILQIDDYVMARAMREFKDIVKKNEELTISVNVSAKDFADRDFVEKVEKILNAEDFPAKNLEIEITEYCMVNSMETTTDNISKLRSLGVQIALDDFGTGYTSLNYVASLPIDLLKIDKSLIDDIENDEKKRDFVKAVITMGQLMDCEVISEGVENDNQIECLKNDGCDYIQGFVWSKPLMLNDAIQLALQ